MLFQPACAGLFPCENCLIQVAIAMGDRTEKTVTVDVQTREGHTRKIPSSQDEVRVLDSDEDRRSHVVERLVNHRFTVTFVRGRAREQAIRHGVVQDLRFDAIFSHQ